METNETKNEESTVTKKKNRIPIIIGIIVAVAAIAVVARFFLVSGSEDNKLSDTLQLADNYLGDLDYENAIASYEEVISIDPKSVDAYAGLANTYIAMADDCVANNKYDDAIKNLDNAMNAINRGLDNVDSDKTDTLKDIQTSIEEKNKTIADLRKEEFDALSQSLIVKEDDKDEDTNSRQKKTKKETSKDKESDIEEKEEKVKEEEKEETEPEKETEQPANQTYIDPYGEEWTKEEILEYYPEIVNVKNGKCPDCGGNFIKEATYHDNVSDENGNPDPCYLHECENADYAFSCYSDDGKYKKEDCPICNFNSSWYGITYNWMLTTGVVN